MVRYRRSWTLIIFVGGGKSTEKGYFQVTQMRWLRFLAGGLDRLGIIWLNHQISSLLRTDRVSSQPPLTKKYRWSDRPLSLIMVLGVSEDGHADEGNRCAQGYSVYPPASRRPRQNPVITTTTSQCTVKSSALCSARSSPLGSTPCAASCSTIFLI